MAISQKWFVRGDLDGLIGLFIDNLLQIMVICSLLKAVCGFPDEAIYTRVLPGAAISILVGNLYYGWQAMKLMKKTGRDDVTALPYGINTPSVFAFIFFIMMPVYQLTKSWEASWYAGLFACFFSGLLETLGSFFGDVIRKVTPRVALLTPLAGIAITFISMDFVFQIFASPLLALIPAILILLAYGSGIRFPFSLPGGLVAVIFGTIIAWLFYAFQTQIYEPKEVTVIWGFFLPEIKVAEVFRFFGNEAWPTFLSIMVPMGLFNVVGSLQNLESAEVAGDSFETRPSMMVNGIGSIVAAFLGSAFPTTIYIGHPAWKKMGARVGYSIVNGILITVLCLVGGITFLMFVIPQEVTLGVLLWIGILMCALAFQSVPKNHMLAAAFGLIPCLAGWAFLLIQNTANASGVPFGDAIQKLRDSQLVPIDGLISLSQGFLLVSMIFAAFLAYIVDRKFLLASVWMGVASICSMLGVIHGYTVNKYSVDNQLGIWVSPKFVLVYAVLAILMLLIHFWLKKSGQDKHEENLHL